MNAPDSALAQALAYVDACLPSAERPEFERRLAADKRLAAQVEEWRLQNDAIRAAFDGPNARCDGEADAEEVSPARASGLRRAAHDAPERRRPSDTSRRVAAKLEPARTLLPRGGEAADRSAPRRTRRRLALALAAAVLTCAASAGPASPDRSDRLATAARSAYRVFTGAKIRPVELQTGDPAALERWLQPQFGRQIAIPRLAEARFALLGGRVIPGAQGPAAFALYQNGAGERIGVAIEPGESAARISPLLQDGATTLSLAAPGVALAIVGETDAVSLAAIARLIGSSDATGADSRF